MDSVTQFLLGAAVGEAVLNAPGKETAERPGPTQKPPFRWGAALLGGVLGTFPDLDVLAAPFLNGPQALGFHRGLTHSIFLCTLLTPVFVILLRRAYPKVGVSSVRWYAFVWLVLNTHWMIDAFTTYGTQVFLPFTNYPVNLDSVFISDPLYLLPLLGGLLLTRWRSRGERVYQAAGVRWGLLLSTIYLASSLVSKAIVWQKFEASLEDQGVTYHQMMTTPTPFNTVLWYALVDRGDEVWVADRSLFDRPETPVDWQRIPKNTDLFDGFAESPAGQRLLWFSRGYYRLEMDGDQPIFVDLRFGRLKSWFLPIEPEGRDYVFQYALKSATSDGPHDDFHRLKAEGGFSQFPREIFWQRLRGKSIKSDQESLRTDRL